MKRGEVWFADTGRGGDRPVLVLTRDEVVDRIGAVVVAELRTRGRGLHTEMEVGLDDGLNRVSYVSFDNLQTLPKSMFRRRVAILAPARMHEACMRLNVALGCGLLP